MKWNALCESFIIYLTGDLVSAKIKSQQNFLTHFSLMIPFYIPSKHQKIFGFLVFSGSIKWDKVFKNGSSEIFGRQPLQNLKWHGLPSNFSKAVFHKFHLVHSWILCPKWEHLLEMFFSGVLQNVYETIHSLHFIVTVKGNKRFGTKTNF